MNAVIAAGVGARSAIRERFGNLPVPALFTAVVVLHWLEHVVQIVQIRVLGAPPARALGALGWVFPELVRSEWLHLAYNVALLVGLAALCGRFVGAAGSWWRLALAAQGWHLFEHALLFVQAQTGARFFGTEAPASVLQLVVARPDLHLVYNGVVTVLVVLALGTSAASRRRAEREAAPGASGPSGAGTSVLAAARSDD